MGWIDLRPEPVQGLTDQNCYDLAWVPVMFLPAEVAARGLHRVRAALRPGGWAVLGSLAAEGEGLHPAVLRLVSLLFGSGRLFPTMPPRCWEQRTTRASESSPLRRGCR